MSMLCCDCGVQHAFENVKPEHPVESVKPGQARCIYKRLMLYNAVVPGRAADFAPLAAFEPMSRILRDWLAVADSQSAFPKTFAAVAT